MIFPNEIDDVLNGRLTSEEIAVVSEHYKLGKFHTNVTQPQREAFRKWLRDSPRIQVKVPEPVDYTKIAVSNLDRLKTPEIENVFNFLDSLLDLDNLTPNQIKQMLLLAYCTGEQAIIDKLIHSTKE